MLGPNSLHMSMSEPDARAALTDCRYSSPSPADLISTRTSFWLALNRSNHSTIFCIAMSCVCSIQNLIFTGALAPWAAVGARAMASRAATQSTALSHVFLVVISAFKPPICQDCIVDALVRLVAQHWKLTDLAYAGWRSRYLLPGRARHVRPGRHSRCAVVLERSLQKGQATVLPWSG
ncbi:MAG: hypothetical protein BWY92_01203 [Firmicutes bacterium ADurb.BinA052]|nr:MAG: hypothetical protein BWY92_01203 [Firmicutes bacterium ADurb.BinA052]